MSLQALTLGPFAWHFRLAKVPGTCLCQILGTFPSYKRAGKMPLSHHCPVGGGFACTGRRTRRQQRKNSTGRQRRSAATPP